MKKKTPVQTIFQIGDGQQSQYVLGKESLRLIASNKTLEFMKQVFDQIENQKSQYQIKENQGRKALQVDMSKDILPIYKINNQGKEYYMVGDQSFRFVAPNAETLAFMIQVYQQIRNKDLTFQIEDLTSRINPIPLGAVRTIYRLKDDYGKEYYAGDPYLRFLVFDAGSLANVIEYFKESEHISQLTLLVEDWSFSHNREEKAEIQRKLGTFSQFKNLKP